MTVGVRRLPSLAQVGVSPLKGNMFQLGRMCLWCGTGRYIALDIWKVLVFCEVSPELLACCCCPQLPSGCTALSLMVLLVLSGRGRSAE